MAIGIRTAAGEEVGVVRARLLSGWWQRLRGLLGTDRGDAVPALLMPCASVHTWGMRYAIDVAFADRAGTVLAVWRALPPGRVVRARGAWLVLERPSCAALWPRAGDTLVPLGIGRAAGLRAFPEDGVIAGGREVIGG